MTMPAMPMPGAQRSPSGWVQMPGGYQPNGAQQGQPQFPQGMQQPQSQQFSSAPLPQAMNTPAFMPPVPMPQVPEPGSWPQATAMQMGAPPPQQQPQMQPQQPQFQSGQPQFQPQPQQQPAPQQQPTSGTIDQNTRLYGTGIPAEMQGRTLGEMTAVYNGMRQVALQHIAGGGQQPQPQGPPQPTPQPQSGQPGQPAPVQTQPWDWRNPTPQIEATVERVVQRTMAPVMQLAASAQVSQAEQIVAAEIGPQVFAQLRPTLYQQLQGADPTVLANPNTWRVAANALIGALALQAARMPQGGMQPHLQGGAWQPQQVPQGAQPIPNIGSFFSEQPGQGGVGVQTPTQASATDRYWADQLMGGNVDLYMAWKTGQPSRQAQPPMQQQWGGR